MKKIINSIPTPAPLIDRNTIKFVDKVKVLLIDDDSDEYYIVKDLLSQCLDVDYQIDWICDVDLATDAIMQANHDVYLLDYYLGKRNALDLLLEVGQVKHQKPFIVLTNSLMAKLDIYSIKSGASDFISKASMSGEILHRSIQYAMERKLYLREIGMAS